MHLNRTFAAVAVGAVVIVAAAQPQRSLEAQAASTTKMPVFEVDRTWPKLPNDWVLGHVPSVAVDRDDHVWILHRPRTVPEEPASAAAPPVLEFDADGKFVHAWGGPGAGYDWPDSEHGIFVDYQGQRLDRRQQPHVRSR